MGFFLYFLIGFIRVAGPSLTGWNSTIIFEGNGPIGFMGYVSPTQWNEPSAHSERTSKTRLRFNCYSVYGETVSTGRIRLICQY